MSAIANVMEGQGISTALVSLVAAQSDPARPPRVLWVPFPLGRPLGPALDANFQRDVLRELLALLDAPSGPVYAEYGTDMPIPDAWQAPDLGGADSIEAELEALAPAHERFMSAVGRTTTGLARLSLSEAARFVAGFDDGVRPSEALAGMSDLLRFRFAADDLKAHYLEAASEGREVDIRAAQAWLWQRTALGRTLKAFWQRSVDHADERRSTVGGRFLVPTDWRQD